MKKINTLLALCFLVLIACQNENVNPPKEDTTEEYSGLITPDWVKNANIYEVNTRQYTPEGTFEAFQTHLPRLKDMGVDILWFMPIHPIGEVKRKGSLGSYYAVKDYTAVNPEHGTMEDFKALVDDIHARGMKVILDWVPNHTAWDHDWITANPSWYTYDNDTITHPLNEDGSPTGWTDVADLNYDNDSLRQAMIADMEFWVREVGIDGFRCDVAEKVPLDFWAEAREELNKAGAVFMLAESAIPEHHDEAFEMTYAWPFKDVVRDIATGNRDVSAIDGYLNTYRQAFPDHAYSMYFITNHDENTWNNFPGNLGAAQDALAVLVFTLEGMPLIYSGQEAGALDNDQLAFFDKDEINWGSFEKADFYKKLLSLKHENKALWNGLAGGKAQRINTSNQVYAFKRSKDEDSLIVVINLGASPATTTLTEAISSRKNIFTGEEVTIVEGEEINLSPWEYLVLE